MYKVNESLASRKNVIADLTWQGTKANLTTTKGKRYKTAKSQWKAENKLPILDKAQEKEKESSHKKETVKKWVKGGDKFS